MYSLISVLLTILQNAAPVHMFRHRYSTDVEQHNAHSTCFYRRHVDSRIHGHNRTKICSHGMVEESPSGYPRLLQPQPPRQEIGRKQIRQPQLLRTQAARATHHQQVINQDLPQSKGKSHHSPRYFRVCLYSIWSCKHKNITNIQEERRIEDYRDQQLTQHKREKTKTQSRSGVSESIPSVKKSIWSTKKRAANHEQEHPHPLQNLALQHREP
ncbi:hypothetical protein M758_UG017200 [Ceratodon purpureus]|nr:hypothetical protein M758_UG017200 [Ceratodon purpureus]